METQVTRARQIETMAVFALVLLLLEIKFHRQALVYGAIAFLLVALFVPSLARVIASGWTKLSLMIAHVNNRIILTIIFYLVLAPLACLYRLFHKDPLGLDQKESESFFCERNHTYCREDLEKMW
jgi:hypothetical protein